MAWADSDIKRSIQRYLGLTLDDEWTIRTQRRQVQDEERPVAVVQSGQMSVLRAREALTQGEVESLLPITITAYPVIPAAPEEPGKDDPPFDGIREADLAATKLKSHLHRLILHGLVVTTEPEKDVIVQWAGPFRIPLWDYEDVPLTGPDRGGPDDPHDVLWVQRESLQVKAIQDPEDDSRWAVICEFRVTVEEPGRVVPDEEGYVAEGIQGSFYPPPGSE